MNQNTDIKQAIQQLTRGADAIYAIPQLEKKLNSGKVLRVKLGMDPTAPDIHLGHSVVLRKLRQFQDLGHKAILIIGDYTAKIGDPTGRDATRPILTDQAINQNAQTYLQQAGKILDMSPQKIEIKHNSQWLAKLSFQDVLKLTGQVTVQQMLQRENFKKRIKDTTEIMISEFMYPLMQGYDSLAIQADVELGGTDQTFNNLMGRQLQEKQKKEKQIVIVMPLLVGLDGTQKMSKSKNNYIGLTFTPNEMYGKIMSIPDSLMHNYFTLLTDIPQTQIQTLTDPKQTHPRDAKDKLAQTIVQTYHSQQAASNASQEFKNRFKEKQLPTDIQTQTIHTNPINIVKLITQVGFAQNNSQAKRLIKQGAVSINEKKYSDPLAQIDIQDQTILKVGKRRICKIITP